jgi:hypothetical protein
MKIPGGFTDGATPLPIPNREVKPIRADGTMLVTAWESRSLPGFFCEFKIRVDYSNEKKSCIEIILVQSKYGRPLHRRQHLT